MFTFYILFLSIVFYRRPSESFIFHFYSRPQKSRGLLFIHLPAAVDSSPRAGTAFRIGCYAMRLVAWELGDDSGIWSSLLQVTAVNACVRLFYMLG